MKSVFVSLFFIILISCRENSSKDILPNWALGPFTKVDSVNPVLLPSGNFSFFCPVTNEQIKWEVKDVFNPAAIVRHDTIFLLFRAEDSVGKYAGTSRIGIAWSTDGFHFNKYPVPVLYPDNDPEKIYEWEGGCEDPRIVEDDNGTYFMTYTAYDGDKARLLVASSKDLYHWTKYGPVFKTYQKGKFVNSWSKSGSIVCKYENGKAIAVKLDGKFLMFWGDTDIFCATSEDLIQWNPLVYADDQPGYTDDRPESQLVKVFSPRKRKFDSDLIEPGPPAMVTDNGVLLIYNSRNIPSIGDSSIAEGTYTASQILFNKSSRPKVIQRMSTYFIKPDKPYEMSGQVSNVCFVEGLVNYKGKWFLYYGTADSKIAVAVSQ